MGEGGNKSSSKETEIVSVIGHPPLVLIRFPSYTSHEIQVVCHGYRPEGGTYRTSCAPRTEELPGAFAAARMGIDPETLRLVARCLNHYATPGPIIFIPSVQLYIYYIIRGM
jgi:hypothetical protein